MGWNNGEAAEVEDIDSDSPHLHGLIPESHDLFQVLHHAYTYQSMNCFYLISSHVRLFYTLNIKFRVASLRQCYQVDV